MHQQQNQLQEALNAAQQAQQILKQANNSPDPQLIQKAQQQVQKGQQAFNKPKASREPNQTPSFSKFNSN